MPIYRITSIVALPSSICNTLKEGRYLIEGKNLSLPNRGIVTISGQRFVAYVYVLFPFNYKIYLICILAIIKKESATIMLSFFFYLMHFSGLKLRLRFSDAKCRKTNSKGKHV